MWFSSSAGPTSVRMHRMTPPTMPGQEAQRHAQLSHDAKCAGDARLNLPFQPGGWQTAGSQPAATATRPPRSPGSSHTAPRSIALGKLRT